MEPLVITATPNTCWLHPEVEYPRTPEELVHEARRCEDAGAAILHLHAEDWITSLQLLRAETDLVLQCGMSSLPIPQRMDIFEHHADMISIILSHHDEAFAEVDTHALHPREELEEYARLAARYGVRLEHEIWHTGSIWNLNYLIKRGLVQPPHITTLFFDWPGGSWTPATIEEYQYRRRFMPEGSVITVSIMGEHQKDILAAAMLHGDNVRVGTEDYPFDHAGRLAATPRLIEETVAMAQALGRPIATPAQAREMLQIPARMSR